MLIGDIGNPNFFMCNTGADRFILGSAEQVFYDEHRQQLIGETDYG